MDYRLIEFTLGLPENFVYKSGERTRAFETSLKDPILDIFVEKGEGSKKGSYGHEVINVSFPQGI